MPVLGPKETVVFIIFGTFLAKVVALWNTRRDFEWHTVLVTVFGSIMGSIPGGYVLNAIPAAYLQILLGIMLLAVMLLMGRKFEINIQNKTAERITALGKECNVVGGKRRDPELLPDHVEQRLVVVKIGHGDPRDDGQHVEQAVRKTRSLFQLQFHSGRFFSG